MIRLFFSVLIKTTHNNVVTVINNIKAALDAAFKQISDEFIADGIKVLMPTYAPQHGKLLSEFARVGGKAHISGGKEGTQLFKNVPQSGLEFDTTAYINMFPPGMCEKIVGVVPQDLLKDKKIVLFTFITPPQSWEKYIRDRGLNTEIVATNEQNTRLFFENKANLVHILEQSGLQNYVIPAMVVESGSSEQSLKDAYRKISNESGKIVVQACGESYEPTEFFCTEEEFVAKLSSSKKPRKIARFIEGSEANLSFFVGNTQPAQNSRGVTKCNLPANVDNDDPKSLAQIEAHAESHGIDASNVFSVTGRATLKVVGDALLANERGDSVGNNIGHIYDENINRQITEVGEKLGRKMALCGKVGLAGADLIIDKSGKIWINEINDRQQGPTDQMSFDAENAGLPGLSRMAWFAHYADFDKQANLNLLATLRDNADAIHQKYLRSKGSFYIKAYATHSAEFNGAVIARKDLEAGLYSVTNHGGQWSWKKAADQSRQPDIDISSGQITLRIGSGALQNGDAPLSGAEMFRITGIADKQNSPFVIENGYSRLSKAWEPLIERLYKDCFGEDYLEKSALRRPVAAKSKNDPAPPAP